MTGQARGKKVDKSAQIGEGGIALIYKRVNAMGYVWHHRAVDAGIDGTIELRDPATGVVTNRLLQVQSKASNRNFPGETDRSFHYLCDENDLDYWMASEVPVLLVCSHPDRDEAWWVHIQGWFHDPVRRASRRVDFDKATQKFDEHAASRMLAIADPHARSHTPVALAKNELLVSNLLAVDVPTYYHDSPLPYAMDAAEIFKQQEQWPGEEEVRKDFALTGDRIITWLPPDATALAHTVTGPSNIRTVDELLNGDPADFRLLIRLLNNTLREDTKADCRWHNGRKVLYFQATPNLTERTINGPTGRAREVFKPKPSKKDPARISYYKHAALKSRFVADDDQWFLELTPTYHFTRDGYQDSRFLSDLLSGIKRLEKNKAVLGATQMWAHYLHGEDTLMDDRRPVLTYGTLQTFEVTQGINDDDWSAAPASPKVDATGTPADEDNQIGLFEVAP